MELQHCIASSGVVTAPQSTAYTASATTIAISKIGFARCISTKLDAQSAQVKEPPACLSWVALRKARKPQGLQPTVQQPLVNVDVVRQELLEGGAKIS